MHMEQKTGAGKWSWNYGAGFWSMCHGPKVHHC